MAIFDLYANSVQPIKSINGLSVTDPISYYVQTTPPLVFSNGDIWYNPSTNLTYIANSGKWWVGSYAYGETPSVIVSATEPDGIALGSTVGDFWYDSANDQVYKWNGTAWALQGGLATSSTTEPITPIVGDWWVIPSTGEVYLWVGTIWELQADTCFQQGTEPEATLIGEFWYNTTDGTLLIWDGTVWVLQTGTVNYTETQQPNINDYWYNPTADILYKWNGYSWVAQTGAAAGTSLNNTKPTIISSTAPTISLTIGDLWYNPDTHILYQWNGTIWVAVYGVLKALTAFVTYSYGATVLVDRTTSPLFLYDSSIISELTKIFPYSQLIIIDGSLSIPYSQLLVIDFNASFLYSEKSPIFTDTTVFGYSLLNNRTKYPLVNTLNSVYSIPPKVVINPITTFSYGGCAVLGFTTVMPYSRAASVFSTLSTPYKSKTLTFTSLVTPYGNTTKSSSRVQFVYSAIPVVKSISKLIAPYVSSTIAKLTTAFKYSNATVATSRLVAPYASITAIKSSSTLKAVYASIPKVKAFIKLNYADVTPVSSKLVAPYKSTVVVNTSTKFVYQEAGYIFTNLEFDWANTSEVKASVDFGYEISAKQYVFLMGKFGYSIENMNVQSIDTTPTLVKDGEVLDYITVKLSSDESSPYWIGDISLARIEDYVKFNVGDGISLQFVDQTFEMIVDGKTLSRGDNASQACQVSLISHAALYDGQFSENVTKFYATSVSAKQVVEDLLGPVVWGVEDWFIPVSQAQFTASTPMSHARKIVSAIGGLIESLPDSTILVRPTFPNNIPDYPQAEAYPLSDSDLFDVKEDIAPKKIINRVALYTSALASSVQDTLEFEYLDTAKDIGTVKAYPSPFRYVDLSTTNNTASVDQSFGERYRTETEFVEFKAGQGSTKYPIDSLVSMTWRTTNLGGVTYEGKNISSSLLAESLLEISYTVRSFDFQVKGTEISQFCLSD